MEDEGTEVDVEIAGRLEDVDVGSNEPVGGVDDDVELVAVEEDVLIDVLTVEEGLLKVIPAVREVAEARSLPLSSLPLSSPQIPVSHGLVEQHPA